MTIPLPTEPSIPDLIYKAQEDLEDGKNRPHLGASIIGSECERYCWNSFRWVHKPSFGGRILMLFKVGFMYEPILAQELRRIGCETVETDPETERQFNYTMWNGMFAGSCDGQITGVPDAPKTPHIVEYKTSNDRNFKALLKKGVKESKPAHYAQMQIYMRFFKKKWALYVVVNKNTSEIYTERVKYDAKKAKALIDKAKKIITTPIPPELLPPTDKNCRWCDFKDSAACHGKKMPQVNCRTCAHSTPDLEKSWICEKFDSTELDLEVQRSGGDCPGHVYIPALLENVYTMVDSGEFWVKYKNPVNGYEFINGDRAVIEEKNVFSSKELSHINPEIQGELALEFAKNELNGTVVGGRDVAGMKLPF